MKDFRATKRNKRILKAFIVEAAFLDAQNRFDKNNSLEDVVDRTLDCALDKFKNVFRQRIFEHYLDDLKNSVPDPYWIELTEYTEETVSSLYIVFRTNEKLKQIETIVFND